MLKKISYIFFFFLIFIIGILFTVTWRKKPGYTVHGIDVSYYQKQVNFSKVVDDGFSFVIIKATEGDYLKDRNFAVNWNAARHDQLIRGTYHFFRADIDPIKQANWFVKHVKLLPGDLPPVLDVETTENVSIPLLRERMTIWLNLVEKKFGIKPIIYTNLSFYNDYLSTSKALTKYPIWIAAYSKFFSPRLEGKNKWMIWQYDDNGSAKGIEGPVDLNVFQGTIGDLRRYCIPGRFEETPLEIHIPKELPSISR
ncbi:glycoside hydrolase family 25 protein [Flammeovirga agarivorans]|uniref:Glycoside hydrolase family 25 protein n=1 Tax=Flammeovirga agarivorans TaxID=2726742 RepID=A0A7X8SM55_9BACT|nr:GH25 family lysozyme [Flammeovirga agarivorans]NLR92677.1 glycoside hydrolase family 25 protein [Flammeovirga agarivorans]